MPEKNWMQQKTLCLLLVVLLVVSCATTLSSQEPEPNSRRLLDAARDGHGGEVESILKSGVSPNVRDESGLTPLHLAAAHGHQRTSQILLDHGAKLNAQDKAGQTPLDHAEANGHSGTAQYLRSKGAQGSRPSSGPPITQPRLLKTSLKFKTLEQFQKEIREPAVYLDDDHVCLFAPKRKQRQARIVFGYLVRAYDKLYEIVGTHTEYKIAVYAFPKGNPNARGGASNCSIEYDDSNLDFEKHSEWTRYKVPHVCGYIEEMAHSFVHATKAQFGWEMVGWSIGTIVS